MKQNVSESTKILIPSTQTKIFLDSSTQTKKNIFRFLDPNKKIFLDSSTETKKKYFLDSSAKTRQYIFVLDPVGAKTWPNPCCCFQAGRLFHQHQQKVGHGKWTKCFGIKQEQFLRSNKNIFGSSTQTKKNIFWIPRPKQKKIFLEFFMTQTKKIFGFLDPNKKKYIFGFLAQSKQDNLFLSRTKAFSWPSPCCYFELVDCFIGINWSHQKVGHGNENKMFRNQAETIPSPKQKIFSDSSTQTKKKIFLDSSTSVSSRDFATFGCSNFHFSCSCPWFRLGSVTEKWNSFLRYFDFPPRGSEPTQTVAFGLEQVCIFIEQCPRHLSLSWSVPHEHQHKHKWKLVTEMFEPSRDFSGIRRNIVLRPWVTQNKKYFQIPRPKQKKYFEIHSTRTKKLFWILFPRSKQDSCFSGPERGIFMTRVLAVVFEPVDCFINISINWKLVMEMLRTKCFRNQA